MIRPREMVKAIERCGGEFVRQKGSHAHYRAEKNGVVVRVIVPVHPGDMNKHVQKQVQDDLAVIWGQEWWVK